MIETLMFYLKIIDKNLNTISQEGTITYTEELILNKEEAKLLFKKTESITTFFGWRKLIREGENVKHLGFIKGLSYSLNERKLEFSIYEEDYILLKQITKV